MSTKILTVLKVKCHPKVSEQKGLKHAPNYYCVPITAPDLTSLTMPEKSGIIFIWGTESFTEILIQLLFAITCVTVC